VSAGDVGVKATSRYFYNMDYQFVRNEQGSAIAEFEMGSEVFARWFSEELCEQTQKIVEIKQAIEELENRQIDHFVWQGNELRLTLTADEVVIRSKVLDLDALEDLPEGTELYDQEFVAGCGLDDFKRVLLSWHQFIAVV
jgi:hypothetical protein